MLPFTFNVRHYFSRLWLCFSVVVLLIFLCFIFCSVCLVVAYVEVICRLPCVILPCPPFLFFSKGGYTRLQGGRWSDSRALSCVERFDSFSQYWTTVSSLHQARSGLGVAVLEGMIYVVGGLSISVSSGPRKQTPQRCRGRTNICLPKNTEIIEHCLSDRTLC